MLEIEENWRHLFCWNLIKTYLSNFIAWIYNQTVTFSCIKFVFLDSSCKISRKLKVLRDAYLFPCRIVVVQLMLLKFKTTMCICSRKSSKRTVLIRYKQMWFLQACGFPMLKGWNGSIRKQWGIGTLVIGVGCQSKWNIAVCVWIQVPMFHLDFTGLLGIG